MVSRHLRGFLHQLRSLNDIPCGNSSHYVSLSGRNAGQTRVFEDSAIEKLHNIKRRPQDTWIFTQKKDLRYWDGRVLQCLENAVFSLNLMSASHNKLTWRLLAHDIFLPAGVFDQVCGIGLAKAKLVSHGQLGWRTWFNRPHT